MKFALSKLVFAFGDVFYIHSHSCIWAACNFLVFYYKNFVRSNLENSRSHFLDNYQKKEISFQAINKYREVVVLV